MLPVGGNVVMCIVVLKCLFSVELFVAVDAVIYHLQRTFLEAQAAKKTHPTKTQRKQ